MCLCASAGRRVLCKRVCMCMCFVYVCACACTMYVGGCLEMCMYVFGVHVVSTKAFGVCEWKEHVVKRIPVSVLGMRV